MNLEEVNEIKSLIEKSKVEASKSAGVIESIKKDWLEKYGTDDVKEIQGKLNELRQIYSEKHHKMELLFEKLKKSNDWESLKNNLL